MLLLTCRSGASVMWPVALELSRTARVGVDSVVFSPWTWLPQPKAQGQRAMGWDAALACMPCAYSIWPWQRTQPKLHALDPSPRNISRRMSSHDERIMRATGSCIASFSTTGDGHLTPSQGSCPEQKAYEHETWGSGQKKYSQAPLTSVSEAEKGEDWERRRRGPVVMPVRGGRGWEGPTGGLLYLRHVPRYHISHVRTVHACTCIENPCTLTPLHPVYQPHVHVVHTQRAGDLVQPRPRLLWYTMGWQPSRDPEGRF